MTRRQSSPSGGFALSEFISRCDFGLTSGLCIHCLRSAAALSDFDKNANDFVLQKFDEHPQCAQIILMQRNKISIFKRQQSRKFYAFEVEMERSGWKI